MADREDLPRSRERYDDADGEYERRYRMEPRAPKSWKPPEWLKWLTPIVLAVLIGGYNSLSTRIHEQQTDIRTITDRMPIDYVPRAEMTRNAEVDKKLNDERDQRVARIESKVDEILQNQMEHRGSPK